ncbi:zinc ribbon domain-containing protein [Streptomyces tirandamycinicus]|uniref:zinc ribbon domain-containing protein n=1 Tax=Streptomyces tirandamycinicus TaxID=2174846 RepID=UPI002699CE86
MIRAHTVLPRPTARRTAALGETPRDHRSRHNGVLRERRDARRHTSKTSITYGDRSAQLREIRAVDPERRGRVRTISVKREGNRWYVVLACDEVLAEELPPTGGIHPGTARALVGDHDVIAHERLDTAGVTKSPVPTADPERPGGFLPDGAAANAGLNRATLDAGWAQFLAIPANRAESAGRLVVPVAARDTSRTCSHCGHVATENRVTRERLPCTACGFAANGDHVGATNVLDRAGLVLCAAARPPTQEARASTRGWSHEQASRTGVERGSGRTGSPLRSISLDNAPPGDLVTLRRCERTCAGRTSVRAPPVGPPHRLVRRAITPVHRARYYQ